MTLRLLAAAALLMLGVADAAAAQTPAPKTFRDCSDCQEMVVIPAGEATLGTSAEERLRVGIPALFGDHEAAPHKVRIAKPFALGKTEVSRGLYGSFVEATKRPDPAGCGIQHPSDGTWGKEPGYSWRKPGFAQTDVEPAVCVSYDDAVAFTAWYAKKTGQPYRLATETEWEYAARAGTTTAWALGRLPEAGCKKAVLLTSATMAAYGWQKSMEGYLVCADRRIFTQGSGSFPPNAFGLLDTLGGVFEWISDCANVAADKSVIYGTPDTPATCNRHFMKGGAFHTPMWLTRSGMRSNPLAADFYMSTIGFRLARDLK